MQQVNLYTHLDQPPTVSDSVLQFFLAAILMLALVVVIALWLVGHNILLKRNLMAANAQASQLTQSVASNAATSSASLDEKIEQLTQQFKDRQALLAVLEQAKSDRRKRFSNQLAGLGRQSIQGLWLNHIQFSRAGEAVALQGVTHKPALLPQYLQALGREEVFVGLRFDLMRMQAQQDSDAIAFEVSISPDSSNNGKSG